MCMPDTYALLNEPFTEHSGSLLFSTRTGRNKSLVVPVAGMTMSSTTAEHLDVDLIVISFIISDLNGQRKDQSRRLGVD